MSLAPPSRDILAMILSTKVRSFEPYVQKAPPVNQDFDLTKVWTHQMHHNFIICLWEPHLHKHYQADVRAVAAGQNALEGSPTDLLVALAQQVLGMSDVTLVPDDKELFKNLIIVRSSASMMGPSQSGIRCPCRRIMPIPRQLPSMPRVLIPNL